MSARLVTIAIPTRNRSALMLRAVRSALLQCYPSLEVLVSDNASADDTAARLAELDDPRLRVLRQPALVPMMEHWDLCLREARGELFMLLSDDDCLEPDAIARLEAALADDVGMAYCGARVAEPSGRVVGQGKPAPAREAPREAILGFFAVARTPFPCTVLTRTADLRRAGGYSGVPLTLIADARAWMAASLDYPWIAYLDEPLATYCVHAGNATSTVAVQAWLDDNAVLARWCADALLTRGDATAADEVMRRRRLLDLGTRITAVVGRSSGVRGRLAGLRDLAALAPGAGTAGAGMLAAAAAHLALPPRLAAVARGVRDRLSGPRPSHAAERHAQG